MEKTKWQRNRDWSLKQEAAGTATPGMMEWLARWRGKGSPDTKAGMTSGGGDFTFGGGGGTSIGNTWDTSAVTNPGGITSIKDSSGLGFSGNTGHFATHTEAGVPLAEAEAAEAAAAAESNEPFNPVSNYEPTEIKAATPFLDSYMRAREAAKAKGPVTTMMQEYME